MNLDMDPKLQQENEISNVPEYWDTFLLQERNRQCVAPVNLFKHAPFADIWKQFATTGLIIEAPNPYANKQNYKSDVYWIARICEFAGYRARIEFERFKVAPIQYAWIPFCSNIPQTLGFADTNRKILQPAPDVAELHPDFIVKVRSKMMKAQLAQNLTTLQLHHSRLVSKRIQAGQIYKLGSKLEVIDLDYLHRNQIATVTGIIGDRIHVTYGLPKRMSKFDFGNFINVKSEHVYPLGWSECVGHYIYISEEDQTKLRKNPTMNLYNFPSYPVDKIDIKKGMALEIRDPKAPHKIVPAFVYHVLKFGYIKVEFHSSCNAKELFTIAYHVTSPYILQCGFAKSWGIEICNLKTTTGSQNSDWSSTVCKLDLSALPPKSPNLFEEGMKLEAVDLYQPNQIRPATIVKVAGHLLLLHFDNRCKTIEKNYQWVDSDSPDIYPVGWAEMVGYRFEGYPESEGPFGPHIVSVKTVADGPESSEKGDAVLTESAGFGELELSEINFEIEMHDNEIEI